MTTKHEGPRRHGDQTHNQNVRHPLAYRIPPIVRITGWMGASAAKRVIVAGGAYGLLPARLAEALIRLGGLRHV